MTTRVILPILNRSVSLFKGLPALYLSPSVSIETVSPEYYYLIVGTCSREYKEFVSTKTKCIQIENINPGDFEGIARNEASICSFILNYFKHLEPAALSFALRITEKKKIRIDGYYSLPTIADVHLKKDATYRIKDNTSSQSIISLYTVVSEVVKKYPSVLLALDRFSMALLRTQQIDKIVDITIVLESLIKGTTELTYKFAVYNSWIAESDKDKRKKCRDLLKLLYETRSAIVHGDPDYLKKTSAIFGRWDEVIELSQKALLYYLLYIYGHDIKNWYEHQEALVLGIEERVI